MDHWLGSPLPFQVLSCAVPSHVWNQARAHHGFAAMQSCWKGEAVVRTFLGGPLHAELAAVQDLLQQCTPPGATLGTPGHFLASASNVSRLVEPGHVLGNMSRDENDAGDDASAAGASIREDVTCPICMVRQQLSWACLQDHRAAHACFEAYVRQVLRLLTVVFGPFSHVTP